MKSNRTKPPHAAQRLLRFFVRHDLAEEVEGDLVEKFYETLRTKSLRKAKLNYWYQVIHYLRPFAIRKSKPVTNPIAMHKHNLLMAFRSFQRYKSSFTINLVGLSSGLTAVLLIYLWVSDELSFDQFHDKKDRLFQVMRHTPGSDEVLETHGSNSVLLPAALAAEMPEVEYVVPLRPTPMAVVSAGKENVKATGWFGGKDFFNAFTYRIIEGDARTFLNDKYAMVISDELAIKLFGSAKNCVGKTVVWDLNRFGDTHIVSGVFESPRENASERFDFLVSYEMFLGKNPMDVNWNSNPIAVYLTLKPEVDPVQFDIKLNKFYRGKRGEDADQMFVRKYSEVYLHNRYENGKLAGGRIDYVILFSIIAAFILVIACINFMNLSTARASRRLKEVGIKKTIGAARTEIILQHLSESMLMAMLSLIVSILLVFILLPQFNFITGKHIQLQPDLNLIVGTLVITLVTGFLSGSYPAFYLSAFRPIEVLKGKLSVSFGESWLRKGLAVFQFSISILLIVAVAVIFLQIRFVQNQNLGYNKNNTIAFERQGALVPNLEVFLTEVKNTLGVVNASTTRGDITNINSSSWGHTWEGQLAGTNEIDFAGVNVNYDFFETLGMPFKEGRAFSRAFGNDEATVILNEAAINAMGMENPIGKWINLFGTQREIIGVVKDFHFQPLHQKIRPLFIILNPTFTDSILVKLESGSEQAAIERVEKLFNKYNPGIPFEITFVDDAYRALYASEQRVASLAKYFAVVAIVISCLGLFGMAAFAVERRTKEIGIRKVLGASEVGIVGLLSRDLMAIVLLSIVISLPIGYLLAHSWLAGFAYRINLEWWLFAGTGALALATAWFTVGSQTIRAAKANPVHCLKNE